MDPELQAQNASDRAQDPDEASSLASDSRMSKEGSGTEKATKRRFWGLGKKVAEEKPRTQTKTQQTASNPPQIAPMRPVSPLHSIDGLRASVSPQRGVQAHGTPSSPGNNPYSSSPRLHSPASSQIFERNVQEDVLPPQASPQIPSHIVTENHIPPVLEASSAAITDNKLDPDTVEIVTHSAHQPAAVTVTGTGNPEPSMSSSLFEDVPPTQETEDSASNYGTLDSADVRRLSFISFADVVQAEHAEVGDHASRNSLHLGNAPIPQRSPSPIRSPVSSHGLGTSPPTSVSPSFKGLESSPNRGGRGPGSPLPAGSPPSGELNIETMRQALRRTRSGDLNGGTPSQPMSAVGTDDGAFERPFK
ncbi:MAG: hypothetical protein Q9227_001935 [Pyrenula ochraceoflavens]